MLIFYRLSMVVRLGMRLTRWTRLLTVLPVGPVLMLASSPLAASGSSSMVVAANAMIASILDVTSLAWSSNLDIGQDHIPQFVFQTTAWLGIRRLHPESFLIAVLLQCPFAMSLCNTFHPRLPPPRLERMKKRMSREGCRVESRQQLGANNLQWGYFPNVVSSRPREDLARASILQLKAAVATNKELSLPGP